MSTTSKIAIAVALALVGALLAFPMLFFAPLMAIVGGSAGNMAGLTCVAGDVEPGDWQTPADAQGAAGLTAEQTAIAHQFWLTAHEVFPRELADQAATVGIAMAKQEADLRQDPTPDSNRDAGPAQQRVLPGWYGGKATIEENIAVVNNPVNAARVFYEGRIITHQDVAFAKAAGNAAAGPVGYHLPGLKQVRGWHDMAVTVAAQRVQRSAYPDAYAKWEDLARELIDTFNRDSGRPAPAAADCSPPVLQGDCPPSNLAVENGLTPDAVLVVRCTHHQFPQLRTILGIGKRPANVDRDHQEGRAVDLMTTDQILGQHIADWAKTHADQLGVNYIIWDAQIWSAARAREGWRACGTAAASCYAGPNDTAAHRDHVHISVKGNGAAANAQANAPTSAAGTNGTATAPLPRGRYTLGPRWGAVGSWSSYHTGLDMRAPIGTPIYAAAAGISEAAHGGGWAGNHCVIRHRDGSATLYAHLTNCTAPLGTPVQAGQQIGAVGMTGRTFGPHLHFEHYPAGSGRIGNPYSTDDPYKWMASLGVPL